VLKEGFIRGQNTFCRAKEKKKKEKRDPHTSGEEEAKPQRHHGSFHASTLSQELRW
jgi:hypothetical protein